MSGIPRRTALALSALVLLAVVGLHREVLLSGMVYHMDDAADGYYPSHVAARRALLDGELPTWERGSWAGWPLVADPYYGVFYPLTALFYVDPVKGLGWSSALHMLLAAAGMFWLLRRRNLGAGPALVGAISLAFGSFMVVRIRHIIFPHVLTWTPFILAGVEGYLARRDRRELALCALATGMVFLCGGLPLIPFIAVLVGGYTIARVATAEERGKTFAMFALAAAVGLALGAPQILPTLLHTAESPRQLGTDFTFASSYAWPDWSYVGTLLVPDAYGGEERGQWFGRFNHWEMAGYYAGLWPVLLAPLGLRRKKPELWVLGGLALVGVLLALGNLLPLHGWFYRFVPLYATLRCPTRALVMLLVAVPILAAEAIAAFSAGKSRKILGAVGAAACILIGGVVIFSLGLVHAAPAALAACKAFQHFTLVLSAGLAVLILHRTGVLDTHRATLLLALVTLLDLFRLGRGYVQPKPHDWAPGTERFAAVDWLLSQKPQDRFVPDPSGPFRLHNLGMTYGIEGASGYDSVSVWRYVNFLWTLNHGSPYPHDKLRDDLAAGDIRRYDSPLVDLLNVRWSIAQAPPASHWQERFTAPPGSPPHARHEPGWDPRLRVYENPHVLPRAMVLYRAQVIPKDVDQARALVRLEPRHEIILDRVPPGVTLGQLVPREFTPAKLLEAKRHSLKIEAEAVQDGILFVSETHYPGWEVWVDGEPAELLRANYAFRGVALKAGKHTVVMRYSSAPVRRGLSLGALGILGLLGLFFRGLRRTCAPEPRARSGRHGLPPLA